MRISLVMVAIVLAPLMGACTAGANADEPVAKNAVTRSPGKPLHPVQVRAVIDGHVAAGAETGATLFVESSRPAASIEVTLLPELGTEMSATRFERSAAALSQGVPVKFDFRFRAVSDEPQPVRALVRVTDARGRVLTRDVTLMLGNKEKTPRATNKRHEIEIIDVPEPEGDAVVPARQEITRDN